MDESIEKLEQWSECSARSAIFTEIANSRFNTTESEVHFESLHGVRWLGNKIQVGQSVLPFNMQPRRWVCPLVVCFVVVCYTAAKTHMLYWVSCLMDRVFGIPKRSCVRVLLRSEALLHRARLESRLAA